MEVRNDDQIMLERCGANIDLKNFAGMGGCIKRMESFGTTSVRYLARCPNYALCNYIKRLEGRLADIEDRLNNP